MWRSRASLEFFENSGISLPHLFHDFCIQIHYKIIRGTKEPLCQFHCREVFLISSNDIDEQIPVPFIYQFYQTKLECLTNLQNPVKDMCPLQISEEIRPKKNGKNNGPS